jgi:peptidoglycan/LPS O-acetylase OafA/YrhL
MVVILYTVIPAFTERSHLPPFWKILTFTQNFSLNKDSGLAFSHAWSLCIEEQFYLFLPLLIVLISPLANTKRIIFLGMIIIFGGILLRLGLWYHYIEPALSLKDFKLANENYYEFIYYPTYTRLDGLVIGLALAGCSIFKHDLWQKLLGHGKLIGILGLLIWGSIPIIQDFHYGRIHSLYIFPIISIGAGCFIISVLSPFVWFSRFKIPGAETIAILAYSIYLTHKQVTHIVIEYLKHRSLATNGFFCFFIAGLCSILVATVLYWIVEKPFLKLRDYLTHQ